MSLVIGIDFGTTGSRACALVDGRPCLIPNEEGALSTPSVVAYTDQGVLVGEPALRSAPLNPGRVIHSPKRLLGVDPASLGGDDPPRHGPFALVLDTQGRVRVQVGLAAHRALAVTAQVLALLKACAERRLGGAVERAVLAIPVAFEAAEQQRLRDAAGLAGLQVAELVISPLAIALGHVRRSSCAPGECLAVCDFGGGSFGVAVLQEDGGALKVRAAAGDATLGGDDFDRRIAGWMTRQFAEQTGISLERQRLAHPRLMLAAEAAKRELSLSDQALLSLPHIAADGSGPRSLDATLRRETYDELTRSFLEFAGDLCRSCLAEAGLRPENVAQVLLAGGQARDPRVGELVRGVFGRPPRRVPDDGAAAIGAAIRAEAHAGGAQGRPDE